MRRERMESGFDKNVTKTTCYIIYIIVSLKEKGKVIESGFCMDQIKSERK